MWDSAPRAALYSLVFIVFLGLPPEAFSAPQCSEVYPGALQGPPPEWTFWGDGAACYVRWKTSAAAENELLSRCRETPGVRFIHFERDRGAGSICIFKLLKPRSAVAVGIKQRQGLRQELLSNQYRKSDAENPVLENVERVVTTWTERCLDSEKAKDQAGAARCWKNGAHAIDEFTSAKGGLPEQFGEDVRQLKAAWLQRSEQLEPYVIKAAKIEADTIRPTSSVRDGPDPTRLSDTAVCSSLNLGDRRKCVRQPISTGSNTYVFGIRSNCTSGIAAAIKTYDRNGRCIRKVVAILPGKGHAGELTSLKEPAVLDAISFRDAGTFECYARRHDNISCDGKVDYAAASLPADDAALVKSRKSKRSQEGVEPVQPIEREQEKSGSSLLTTLSTSLKNLLSSD
jgi:hypothetical protein